MMQGKSRCDAAAGCAFERKAVPGESGRKLVWVEGEFVCMSLLMSWLVFGGMVSKGLESWAVSGNAVEKAGKVGLTGELDEEGSDETGERDKGEVWFTANAS